LIINRLDLNTFRT